MIKDKIKQVKIFCKAWLKNESIGETPEQKSFSDGAKSVSKRVLEYLGEDENLYSVYELNPYAKTEDKWEEIAIAKSPESAKIMAEALSRYYKGQIDVGYDDPTKNFSYVEKIGSEYKHI